MSGSVDRNTVNRANCAKIFGVSVKTVSAWVRRGCPIEQKGAKGKEWLFNTPDVFRWHLQNVEGPGEPQGGPDQLKIQPANYDQARARKMLAEAAIAEIDLAKAEGRVVDVELVAEVVTREYSTVRARLTALPGRLAPELDAARALEFEPVIAEMVDDILKELSADDVIGEPTDEAGGGGVRLSGDPPADVEAGSAA